MNIKWGRFFVFLFLIFSAIFTVFSSPAYAFIIDKVVIEGNKRIPESRVLPYLIKEKTEFTLEALDESIKKLYDTGLFMNIDGDIYVDGENFVLKYILEEMPLVGSVSFQGNKEIKSKTIREKVTIKTGQVLNFKSIEEALDAIRAVYEDENRYGTKVSFRIEQRTVNSVDVIFDIEESEKSKIYNIRIYGNEHITSEEIKKTIPTKERKFWSLISSSGKISKESLFADIEIIRQMYLEKGYAKVALGDADLRFSETEPEKVDMIVRIREGDQYFVRSIEIDGYENISLDTLKSVVGLKVGDIFNIRQHHANITNLTELYTSSGYAYANVEPIVSLDDETKEVDIVYKIEENILVHIGRITISGNKRSYDNVIRRQIDQMEGELYNSTLIREAEANTMATGFYESVKISEKGDGGDVIDLDIDVVEQRTGTFTVGAAYSTVDGIMGMAQLSRNNFMGWGHSLSLKAEIAETRTDFSLSYTNPWFMDWPVSLGIDLFNYENEWYDYTRRSVGGSVRIGHALIKRRLFMNYRFAVYTVDIYDIDKYASRYIKEQEGELETHSISPAIIWNSLNNAADPTAGNKSQLYVDYAGNFLGGDAHYVKFGAETSQFVPLIGDNLVFMLHGEVGYIIPSKPGAKIPIDERFRLGGINSVRGFDFGEISPKDEDGFEYGGDKYFQVNAELIFPIKKDIKLKGVAFVDIGQSYSESEPLFSIDFRKSIGVGLRWLTPMGPFRLEWGYKLDKRDDESPYKFEFSIGGTF